MYTLVVVDMQHDFPASRVPKVRQNVAREIQLAMAREAAIVFLEFYDNGPTLPELSELVEDYKKHCTMEKSMDDGSPEVATAIRDEAFPSKQFKVVGVNTGYCVMSTAKGLAYIFPESKVEVIADACNCLYSHEAALHKMSNDKKITVYKELDAQ